MTAVPGPVGTESWRVSDAEADALDWHMSEHMYRHSISNNINGMSCDAGCRTRALRTGVDEMLRARAAALPPPVGEGDGDVLRQHRREWASWLESWQGAVGPEPPTVDAVIRCLRADTLPFGRTTGDRS